MNSSVLVRLEMAGLVQKIAETSHFIGGAAG